VGAAIVLGSGMNAIAMAINPTTIQRRGTRARVMTPGNPLHGPWHRKTANTVDLRWKFVSQV